MSCASVRSASTSSRIVRSRTSPRTWAFIRKRSECQFELPSRRGWVYHRDARRHIHPNENIRVSATTESGVEVAALVGLGRVDVPRRRVIQ
jgi:hypothetical protein